MLLLIYPIFGEHYSNMEAIFFFCKLSISNSDISYVLQLQWILCLIYVYGEISDQTKEKEGKFFHKIK